MYAHVKYNAPTDDQGHAPLRDFQWFKEMIVASVETYGAIALKILWNFWVFKWLSIAVANYATGALTLSGGTTAFLSFSALPVAMLYMFGYAVLYIALRFLRDRSSWKEALLKAVVVYGGIGLLAAYAGNIITTAAVIYPFLLFFAVDTFFFFYMIESLAILLHGRYLGLGKVTSWAGVNRKLRDVQDNVPTDLERHLYDLAQEREAVASELQSGLEKLEHRDPGRTRGE